MKDKSLGLESDADQTVNLAAAMASALEEQLPVAECLLRFCED